MNLRKRLDSSRRRFLLTPESRLWEPLTFLLVLGAGIYIAGELDVFTPWW